MARKEQSVVFIGIDLAWKASNPSGGAVIRDGRLIAHTGALGSNDEIVAFVTEHLPQKGGAVVAVDAPYSNCRITETTFPITLTWEAGKIISV